MNTPHVRPLRLAALLLFHLPFAAYQPILAQTARFDVTGVVVDTTGKELGGATVVVMHTTDSTLVSFGVTKADGTFRISRVPSGEHLLQVTFVGFEPLTQRITVENAPLDVGQIALEEAVSRLSELVISAEHVPIVIKKDTLEYNAAAFPVRPNANVEELLKRLPGIEVERDGSIKAQGEDVEKVLVDGKEFFGNDPTVATRNLPADAVDRVQVFDKKSDMAEFTGVDDGEDYRTINLALKEDRKNGYFGNAAGSVGDPGRYDAQVNLNRFSPTTQLSLISNLNNVNRQGFNINDFVSFMGGIQNLAGGGGRIQLSDLPINTDVASGFSTTLSGGLNFNHDFSARTTLRSSYLTYYLDHDQDRSVLQHQLSGAAGAALSDQQVDQTSRNFNHRLNLYFKHVLSEGQDLQLRSNLQISDSDLSSLSNRETRIGGALENDSRTRYSSSSDVLNGDATLTYRKRFAPGRSLAAEARVGLNEGDQSNDLDALNRFYEQGDLLTSEEIAQLQDQLSNTLSYSQRLTYTEPLGKRKLLQLSAEHRSVLEDQERNVFDRPAGLPLELNESLSSAFDRTYRYYRGGVDFRHVAEPFMLNVGVVVQQANLAGTIRNAEDVVDRRFTRLLPSLTARYDFSQSRHLEFEYTAATREPSMRDLQPFVDNSDPLNLYVGNPDLRPEYRHNAVLRFLLFDQFTFTNLFAFLRATYTDDKITRVRTIDEGFRQTHTNTNAGGDWTLSGNVSFGTPFRPLGVKLNLSVNSTFNRGFEYVNGDRNTANIFRNAVDLGLENRDKEVLDVAAGARYTFNDVRYSLNTRLNQSYVNRTFYGLASWQITDKWRLSTEIDYHLYSKEVFGAGRSVPLWHAELARTVMNDRAEVVLSVRDLLDRNEGISYSNTSTYIQEEHVASLGRYVMLKFVYNLSGIRHTPAIMIAR